MSQFTCGLFFFLVGVALVIHNGRLVDRCREYRSRNATENVRFERVLCVLSGLISSIAGYFTMLSSSVH